MKRKIALLLCVLLLALECVSGASLQASAGATVNATTNIDMDKLIRMDELVGWATVAGEGLEGVTGGGDAEPVVVTTLDEFTKACSDNIPRVIVVSGTIVGGGSGIKIGSNKTIVGIDENATIQGGIAIHNQSNIIVSNLNMHGVWPVSGADDCVEVKNSHHLWFNHLNVWNSWDGNMDITIGSDYITVSWCKFWYTDDANDGEDPEQDHRLSNLVGSGTGHDDTDMGRLRVTYHHNWFADNLDQRMPRVMYGKVHIYNNYYTCQGNTYCIGADCYASILVENNYFYKVKNPHQFSYGNGFPSCIVARGNTYDTTKGKKDTGEGDDEGGYAVPFETTVYDYYLSDAADVPELVKAYAGTQDMSTENSIPEALKNATLVKGQEDVIIIPDPFEEEEETIVNDNPITYDEASNTYTYHGKNSDGSNGFYKIENPFAGKDYSETPTYEDGKPVWTKGATISYWVKVPDEVTDFPVLNFNLKERQMERSDLAQYNLCKDISYTDESYDLGTKVVYVDANGKEYIALEGYGENVRANPEYPAEGYYYADKSGGAYKVYKKGTDPKGRNAWTYLNYIGSGLYDSYSRRYYEEGGETSKIKEADIKGSLSLYASGSMGYRQDDWTGLQRNPYLPVYGSTLAAHIYNQFYYWGNGGSYSLKNSSLKTPTMEEKDEWHFVTVVIQNDWIQYYMDGVEMTTDYLNWWGSAININTASDSFNLGYGQKMNYKNYTPDVIYQQGKTILEFISDEDTVLTIGGTGYCAANLGQNIITTASDAQVKDVQFYYSAVSSNCILEDRIDLSKGNTGEEAPDKSTATAQITFNSNGGSSEDAMNVTTGTKVGKLPVPEKEGYIFKGWYTNKTLTSEFTANSKISKATTVYAKWEKRTTQLFFEPGNGEIIAGRTVNWNEAVGELPIVEKENCEFLGWYADADFTTEFTAESRITDFTTIYAKWQADETIKGDMNQDGTVDAKDALMVLKYVAKIISDEDVTDLQKELGNVNGDESIDAKDALMILKYVANLIDGFES